MTADRTDRQRCVEIEAFSMEAYEDLALLLEVLNGFPEVSVNAGCTPFRFEGTNSDWTGLTSPGDHQAGAKVRVRHVRLVFG